MLKVSIGMHTLDLIFSCVNEKITVCVSCCAYVPQQSNANDILGDAISDEENIILDVVRAVADLRLGLYAKY